MKVFFALLVLSALGLSAHATSLRYGPYASLEVGAKHCTVHPEDVNVDVGTFESAVRSSIVARMKTVAIHVAATNPPVKVFAGVAGGDPTVGPTLIYEDGGSIQMRDSQSAKFLVDLVFQKCQK